MDKNIQEILVNNVLLSSDHQFDRDFIETLRLIKREKIVNPVITISSNTSSIIAGSEEIHQHIRNYLDERKIEADIIEVGSIGLVSLEPIVSVQLPGKTRLYFKQVNPENVISILDGTFNNFIQQEFVLGQLRNKIHEPWEQVPFLDEIAYFKNQQRLILDQCGFIDPNSIYEYIASEGYKTFVQAISQNTPEEVCSIVEDSQLRGRGGEGYLTGKKWKITYETPADQKYLICNAGESDPGAFMERLLIESDPHKVVEGIAIASYAVGAQKAFIYIES
ncbi:MAG: hypothetical protein R6V23_05550, partial [Bacteroidales bacterium]